MFVAHLTQVHSRLLGKHGMKQARIIDVEFNVNADEERKSRRFNRDGFVGRGARRYGFLLSAKASNKG